MQVLYQDLVFEFTFTVQNTYVFFLKKVYTTSPYWKIYLIDRDIKTYLLTLMTKIRFYIH